MIIRQRGVALISVLLIMSLALLVTAVLLGVLLVLVLVLARAVLAAVLLVPLTGSACIAAGSKVSSPATVMPSGMVTQWKPACSVSAIA